MQLCLCALTSFNTDLHPFALACSPDSNEPNNVIYFILSFIFKKGIVVVKGKTFVLDSPHPPPPCCLPTENFSWPPLRAFQGLATGIKQRRTNWELVETCPQSFNVIIVQNGGCVRECLFWFFVENLLKWKHILNRWRPSEVQHGLWRCRAGHSAYCSGGIPSPAGIRGEKLRPVRIIKNLGWILSTNFLVELKQLCSLCTC